MDERLVWQGVSGVFGIVILVAFVVASGVMPWVILAGAVTSLSLGIVSREWLGAFVLGVVVAGVISVFGIVAMVSPGWYKGLL